MAMQPTIARQNRRGVWLHNQLPATASKISSLQRRRPFFTDSSLMPRSAIDTAIRWKASASYPSKPCRATSALAGRASPTRRLDKRLQRYTLWLCSRSSRPRCSPVRKHWMQLHSEERDRPGSTHHQSHRSGSIRAPPLDHDDGDERGGQSSLP